MTQARKCFTQPSDVNRESSTDVTLSKSKQSAHFSNEVTCVELKTKEHATVVTARETCLTALQPVRWLGALLWLFATIGELQLSIPLHVVGVVPNRFLGRTWGCRSVLPPRQPALQNAKGRTALRLSGAKAAGQHV